MSTEKAEVCGAALASFAFAMAGVLAWLIALTLASLLVPWVVGGIVCGVVALVKSRAARIRFAEEPQLGGRKLALAGAVLGIILVVPVGVFVFAPFGR
jgi:hypothetical protein